MLRVMNYGDQFNSIASALPCVVIKAQLSNDNEISTLVDLVDRLATKLKYLVVAVPKMMNSPQLQNKSINYNVAIHHDGNKISNDRIQCIM